MREFRRARDANERKARAALIRTYGAQYRQATTELERLLAFIDAEQLAGRPVKSWRFTQRDRLQRMIREAERRLLAFGADASKLIDAERVAAVDLGTRQAGALIRRSLREAPTRVVAQYGRTSTATLEAVTASVQSRPLRELFDQRAGIVARQVEDMLTTGIAHGWHPTRIAREFRKVHGRGLDNAMTIARTETMRAHREAAYATYQDNSDVVVGMVWVANTEDCCAACLAMHGTELELGEEVDGHPNCKCDAAPRTVSYAELGFPGIEDPVPAIEPGRLPARASVDQLAARFGNRGLATALHEGRITLADTVVRTSNPRWGSMRRQASLTQALENAERRAA